MIKPGNIRNHFQTITEHKLLVMKHCFQVGLYGQGLLHDLSKYGPEEFLSGALVAQMKQDEQNARRVLEKYK